MKKWILASLFVAVTFITGCGESNVTDQNKTFADLSDVEVRGYLAAHHKKIANVCERLRALEEPCVPKTESISVTPYVVTDTKWEKGG